ncbi:MAG TPA: redoxin domain-containing protein [Candidatus Thermoplasmatota archaeon]|nr:redoxin domain-containing protein [Candidatus Thermoplasmatota archaeon]
MRRNQAFAIAALLGSLLLAGCVAPSAPAIPARAGDFVVADVEERGPDGSVVARIEGARWYLGPELPGRLPEGWTSERTRTATPGLVAAFDGLRPGESRVHWADAADAYGERSDAKVLRVAAVEAFPRVFERAGAPPTGSDPIASFFGLDLPAVVIAANGSAWTGRYDPAPEHAEAPLPQTPWHNERHSLWTSRLLRWDEEGMYVTHEARQGANATIGGLAYRVVSVGQEIVVDTNHPRAGENVTYAVRLREVVFAGPLATGLAPELRAQTLAGAPVELRDLAGRAVVLDFFASWCVTCQTQLLELSRARDRLPEDVAFVSVSVDPRERAQDVEQLVRDAHRLARREGHELRADWTFAVDPSGAAARDYAVYTLPKTVVVDPNGRIRASHSGILSADEIVATVRAVLP